MTKWIGGQFLIASPYLTDPNFFRSVIYMVRHDAEGAFGVVVNRPSGQRLADAFTDLLGRAPKRNDAIFFGGPVNGPLVGLHSLAGLGDPADADVVGTGSAELWITADEDHLRTLVDRTDIQARFIARYSGWGPSQLDHEIQAGGWLVAPYSEAVLFGDHESSWEHAVKSLGRDIISKAVAFPTSIDPQRN
ncbi:MAG: YqgE/AlgH family protein [Planctomycetaceae bacterium]